MVLAIGDFRPYNWEGVKIKSDVRIGLIFHFFVYSYDIKAGCLKQYYLYVKGAPEQDQKKTEGPRGRGRAS